MEKGTKKNETEVSHGQFLSIFENSINAILFGIPDGTLLDANPAAVEMFGYSIEELRKLGRGAIFDTTDPKMIAALKTRTETGKAKGEIIGIRKNGERFPCEFSSAIFKTETGESRTSTVLNDISERKKAEEEITLLMDNTEESFVLIDKKLNIISFNKQFKSGYEKLFHKSVEKGLSIIDFAQEDRKEILKNIYSRVFNGEAVEDEIKVLDKNSESYIFSVTYKPAIDEKTNVVGAFVTLIDVTEKRKAQNLVISNEKRFRTIIEHAEDLIMLTDVKGGIIYVSPSVEKITGFSQEDILNKSCWAFIHPDYINESKLIFEELLQKPGLPIPRLTKILHKNGDSVWVEGIATNLLQDDNVKAIVLNYRNITEKINTNHQKEFEKNNRDTLINSTNDLIWSINKKFQLFVGNNAFIDFLKKFTGVALSPGDNVLNINFFSEEILAFWKSVYERGFAGETVKTELYTPEFENTPRAWAELTVNPLYDGDEIIGAACYSRNITEKKVALLKLHEKNELFEVLTSKIPAAIYQFEMKPDGKMRFPYISEGIEKINPNLDIELLKEDASSAFNFVHPDDLEKLIESIELSRNSLTDWVFEYRSIISKDEIIWTKGMSSPEKKEDGTIVWYGYFQDVTEQKISNEKIKLSNERYDIISKATNDVIWDWDLKTNKVIWNKGVMGIFGYNYKQEVTETSLDWWYNKIHPNDIERVSENIESRIRNKNSKWEEEYRFCCQDGTYKYIHDRGFLVIQNDTPIRMIGAMQDISERKKSEKNLEQTLNLLNRTSELAKIGGWEIDFTNNEYYWSSEIYRILEVEDNFTPTIDKVTTFFAADSKRLIKKAIRDGIKKGLSWDLELQMITATGKTISVRAQGSVITENNKTVKLLGTIQDITERKNTVEKLIESEQRFKTIFDAEPECVKLIGPKGDLIEINKAGVKIHEADSAEQMKSLPIIKFIVPEHRNAFNELHSSTMEGVHGFLEFEIKGLKGTRRWLEAHSAPIYDSFGNVVMMLSVTRDITERKFSEKALLESQQRFKTIFEAVPECVKLINADGEVLEMNNAGLLMLDADSVAHVNSFGFNYFVLPKYKKAFKKLHQNAMMGLKGMLEFEVKSLKGTKKWFETHAVPMINSENKIETTLAVTRDITQNKQEEHFLKLLESVITNTNDSVMITEAEPFDEPGPKIVYVNEAFTKMTGYTLEDVVGKSPRILQGPKSDKTELKRLSESMRKWKPCEVSIINYKKNGEEFWINFSIKPIADETGWYTHWIAVERDVTQQKNNDLEREQIIAELSQNNKDLKQFSYVTSHNLRAPIANLLGLTSLLDQYEISDKSLLQILDGIRKSALIFDDTVKDLTKVLIIKDQTNIIKEEVSFLNVINNILRQLSIAINDHEVRVNYNFDDVPVVNFTTAYLESILLNLFTNAIKYKSSKRKLKINIITYDAGDFIILKFEDNGMGIDTEKYKDKLFKLYQRFHENPDGKGLGLYLTKSQIEALGGTIEIESEVGKGTMFILKFKK